MLLFAAILYISAKSPLHALTVLRRTESPELLAGATLMRAWSVGMIAAFIGLAVGIFFLSFTYHYVLWIYVGLAGALYSAIRRHDASFRVRLTWLDLGALAAIGAVMIVAVFFYTRWKLGG
jgi:hypothetical protein